METQFILIFAGLISVVSLLLITWLLMRPSSGASRGEDSLSRLQQARSGSRQGQSHWSQTASAGSSESSKQFGDRIVQAGLYRRNSVRMYILTKTVLSLVPIGIGLALGMTGMLTMTQGVFVGLVLSLVGMVLPSFWLDSLKRSRQQSIRRALPDALDVIVVCMEAGLSIRAGITRVAKELQSAHPMLSGELVIVEREIQLGCSAGEALRRFAMRFDVEELRSLAAVITQAEKFGSSIANALRVHADDMRVKRFQLAEEKAQKAAVKLLFPTMLCIFPTLYVVLLGPAVIELTSFFKTMGGGN